MAKKKSAHQQKTIPVVEEAVAQQTPPATAPATEAAPAGKRGWKHSECNKCDWKGEVPARQTKCPQCQAELPKKDGSKPTAKRSTTSQTTVNQAVDLAAAFKTIQAVKNFVDNSGGGELAKNMLEDVKNLIAAVGSFDAAAGAIDTVAALTTVEKKK